RLGAILDKMGDKEACIKQMLLVISLDPQHFNGLNYLAYTWAEMGVKLDEALTMSLKALELKPDSGFIIDTVAWVYYKKGDFPKAVQYLEKAIKLVDDDPTILEHLGDAYVKTGAKSKALDAYSQAKKLSKGKPDVLENKIEEVKKQIK
ncbi:MAG: tetratricopeptide repeat protein, partial [Deltaproteobacteria bacterium]|nr:tetratricopeptide repeat protein [Deltaproteobacteria bacterium]